jgi:hypothetical protein
MPPQEGIVVEAVGDEPSLVPVEVLLADEREILTRRHAEAHAERPAELARASEAATPGNLDQRALVVSVRQHEPQGLVGPARQQHGANATFRGREPVERHARHVGRIGDLVGTEPGVAKMPLESSAAFLLNFT